MGSVNTKEESETLPVQPGVVKNIQEADRLVVDATALQCPTCFETYVKSPRVLQCGHSFCFNCISHFVRPPTAFATQSPTLLECPLCLRRTAVINENDKNQLAVVNFAMDNILDSLRTISLDETCILEEAVSLIPTLRFENKRLRKEMEEKEKSMANLRQQVAIAERKAASLKTALDECERENRKERRELVQVTYKRRALEYLIMNWKETAEFSFDMFMTTALFCGSNWNYWSIGLTHFLFFLIHGSFKVLFYKGTP